MGVGSRGAPQEGHVETEQCQCCPRQKGIQDKPTGKVLCPAQWSLMLPSSGEPGPSLLSSSATGQGWKGQGRCLRPHPFVVTQGSPGRGCWLRRLPEEPLPLCSLLFSWYHIFLSPFTGRAVFSHSTRQTGNFIFISHVIQKADAVCTMLLCSAFPISLYFFCVELTLIEHIHSGTGEGKEPVLVS